MAERKSAALMFSAIRHCAVDPPLLDSLAEFYARCIGLDQLEDLRIVHPAGEDGAVCG